MDAQIIVSWKLVVTSDEFRLVQKALRGVLTEEEKPQALALQEQLMRIRARQAKQLMGEAEKALFNIEKDNEVEAILEKEKNEGTRNALDEL